MATENKCPQCGQQSMLRGAHKLKVRVGERTVESTMHSFEQCENCGYYELPAAQLECLELRAALLVLRQCERVSGAVLRYARKALGLRQVDLADQLGTAPETISRIETGDAPASAQYKLALEGLLARASVAASGGNPDADLESDCGPISRVG